MALTILRFQDPNIRECWIEYVVETGISEDELQKLAEQIRDKFEGEGFEDWSYDDITGEMEKIGHIKRLNFEYKEIYI